MEGIYKLNSGKPILLMPQAIARLTERPNAPITPRQFLADGDPRGVFFNWSVDGKDVYTSTHPDGVEVVEVLERDMAYPAIPRNGKAVFTFRNLERTPRTFKLGMVCTLEGAIIVPQ